MDRVPLRSITREMLSTLTQEQLDHMLACMLTHTLTSVPRDSTSYGAYHVRSQLAQKIIVLINNENHVRMLAQYAEEGIRLPR